MAFSIIVNGTEREVTAGEGRSLLEVLREDLAVTGPKLGCGEGACGACTVLIGRRAVTSCITPADEAAGQRVTTAEGLAEDGILHPVQQAWLETGAMQCGYCTPGWLTATAALLNRATRPDDARIAAELAGNVCRCCTYPRIRRAVRRAAQLMEEPERLEPVPQDSAGLGGTTPPDPPGNGGRGLGGTTPPDPPGPVGELGATRPGPLQPGAQPWDQGAKDQASFFEQLPDGLVTVVASDDDAWVHVGADGAVTAFTGKVEAGQGTRTALGLLVAEELAVPPASVRVIMGHTDVSPFDLGTFGSRSMPFAAPPLRAAAAAARETLREAAAERFGLPAGDLTVADGIVAGPDGAPSAGYGDLLTGVRRVERVPAGRPVTPPADWRSAGRPLRAAGAADVVTGAKRFPADLRLDRMLHGCVLRAPAFGATLRRADTAPARAVPGVSVVTEGDFIGVVAPSAAAARRGVGAIDADWDRPPQPDRDELAGYLRSHPIDGEGFSAAFRHEEGDADAALATAAVRLSGHYTAAYIAHVPLEPRSAVADWRDGHLIVWTGTSTPFRARQELSEALGLAEDHVHVIVPDYGGGFGGKHGAAVAAEAARLARAAGRPVKVQWNRHEEFHWGYLRPAALIDIESGADESGQITGWTHRNVNSGAVGLAAPYYRLPQQRLEYQPADSPLPQGAYRALAATANTFARESHLDELAHRAGANPLEFRLRHLADDRLAGVLRAAADRLGRPPGPGAAGHGTGIAVGMEKGGRVATAAEVRVDGDGALHVDRLVTAFDCGAVVNPDNLANQVEGAVMMGLGGALFEAIDFADGQIRNASLSLYRVPRLPDLPEIEVVLLDQPDQPSAGGGETPIIAVAPAIGNAIFSACGVRLRDMPLAPRGVVAI
ncbi:MAG TPA: molybdopterin cofactor-binding domain-containing protein [Streptosporangiaceae bacterium]|nr:molybdopterin cofactor-binding domain-containing protein [Streptosporangiaceae bacterium]